MRKPHTVTIRLTDEQHERLHRATGIGPYRIPITEVITRGIELATQELEAMASAAQAVPDPSTTMGLVD